MEFVLLGMNADGWNEVLIGVQKTIEDLAWKKSLSSFAPGLEMILLIIVWNYMFSFSYKFIFFKN